MRQEWMRSAGPSGGPVGARGLQKDAGHTGSGSHAWPLAAAPGVAGCERFWTALFMDMCFYFSSVKTWE